jgi:methionine sulfoxide reductase heme-binding subunit
MILSPRFRTRAKHHTMLLICTGSLLLILIKSIPGDDLNNLWSMGTGYVSIILLAATLLIGFLNIYTKRLNPVSTDLRRDVGIWCGLTGVAHIVIGIQVHMGNIWLYFFKAIKSDDSYELRSDLFGFSNYAGLITGLLVVVLLALSNDTSLKWLRSKQWKSIQRWNYLLFALVLAHGIMYQIIEKRIAVIIILFFVIMLLPMIGQSIGFTRTSKNKN